MPRLSEVIAMLLCFLVACSGSEVDLDRPPTLSEFVYSLTNGDFSVTLEYAPRSREEAAEFAAAFRHANPNVRAGAVATLAPMRANRDVVGPLVRPLLRDPDLNVRLSAATTLSRLDDPDPEVRGVLVEMLRVDQLRVVVQAGRALETPAGTSHTDLVALLGSPTPLERCGGALALGGAENHDSIESLLLLALADDDQTVQACATWGLARMSVRSRGQTYIERLIAVLGRERLPWDVRYVVIEALADLAKDDASVRERLAARLRSKHEQAVTFALALAGAGEVALPQFIAELGSKDPKRQTTALIALCSMQSEWKTVLPMLEQALASQFDALVAYCLPNFGALARHALPRLRQLAEKEREENEDRRRQPWERSGRDLPLYGDAVAKIEASLRRRSSPASS